MTRQRRAARHRAGRGRSSTNVPSGPISPVSSASGMNSSGRRLAPAHERLDADQPAAGQVDLRLVVDLELRCSPAPSAARCSSSIRRRMRARVASENSSTRSLPDSLAWYIAVSASRSSASGSISCGRGDAAADAHAHVAALAGDVERRDERAAHAAGGDRRARSDRRRRTAPTNSSPPMRATHVALVATAPLQALRDLDQQPVAGLVAEAVVDDLEVVEVEEQHGDAVAAPERGAQRGQERGAVGRPGERVEPGAAWKTRADKGPSSDRPASIRAVERLRTLGARA